jgi:hypothetical protein
VPDLINPGFTHNRTHGRGHVRHGARGSCGPQASYGPQGPYEPPGSFGLKGPCGLKEHQRRAAALVILAAIFALSIAVAVAATAVSIGLVGSVDRVNFAVSQDTRSGHHLWKMKKAPAAISAKPMA